MASGGAVRVNFGDILQAISDKLVADLVANAAQITWAVNSNAPQLSGPWDILLNARNAERVKEDGGGWDFRLTRLVDVTIRSQSIKDSGGTNRSWVKAQFVLEDRILNSLLTEPTYGTFWPTAANGDLLTTMPLIAVADAPPARISDDATFGDTVVALQCVYMPLIVPLGP